MFQHVYNINRKHHGKCFVQGLVIVLYDETHSLATKSNPNPRILKHLKVGEIHEKFVLVHECLDYDAMLVQRWDRQEALISCHIFYETVQGF